MAMDEEQWIVECPYRQDNVINGVPGDLLPAEVVSILGPMSILVGGVGIDIPR